MFTPRRPRDRPIVLAALLCAGLVAARVEAAPPTRVLVLHWFGLDAAFRPAFDAALQEELKVDRDRSVELYSETLEGYRFSPEANEQLMKEYLQRKYAGRPPDVIVAVWDQAVAFLTKYRGELFPGVPIVYTIERTPTGADRAAGMTGLWGSAAVRGTMDLIASLQPNARRLIVVDSIPQTSGSVEVEVRSQFDKLSDRMSLVYIKNQPLPEVLATLKDAPADSVVLFIRQMIRTPTEAMSQLEGLDEVVRATRVPVYGIVEGLVGRGVIGGYVMPSRLTAKAIAGMVLQIAHGTPVRDLPPAKRTAIPVFDWQQLERWHISERSLPTGSVVLNRPPAIWREHPLLAMAVSGVLIGQLTLIAVLVVHRGRRRRAEGLLRRSEARTTALLRMVPDLMFVMSRDGVYLDYHARNPDDLFVKPDQFVGKSFRDIFSPDLARVFEEKFAEALVSDEPVVVEYSLPMPGGERHYETRLQRCDNETIMTIVRDVTLRHQAEEHLHWAQAELQHASRIRALGELAAGIAHEVNQPLAAIITNARTGQRGLDAHPPNAGLVRDVLHDIVADGKRASDVIARVRSMVNQQPLRRTPSGDQRRDSGRRGDQRTGAPSAPGGRAVVARPRPAARAGRSDPTAAGAPQPGVERRRRDADRQRARPDAGYPLVSAGWSCDRIGRGLGQRALSGGSRPDFHALLHNQAGRHGCRPVHQPLDHRGPRRQPETLAQLSPWRRVRVRRPGARIVTIEVPETVFVVDDDPSLRTALTRLLASVGLRSETFSTGGRVPPCDRSVACRVPHSRRPDAWIERARPAAAAHVGRV